MITESIFRIAPDNIMQDEKTGKVHITKKFFLLINNGKLYRPQVFSMKRVTNIRKLLDI